MSSELRVASPPETPLLVYDGACRFCNLWINRWRQVTGERVHYLPYQDPRFAAQFQEVPLQRCETAVQLIDTDGFVYSGAQAALRALATERKWRWLWRAYQKSAVFARLSERTYRFVADHRGFFSALTWLGWGNHVERQQYVWVRAIFLRCLAVIYLAAFLSLFVQILGLVGMKGVLPAQATMDAVRQHSEAQGWGMKRYVAVPTLCWVNSSDNFLKLQCVIGAVASVLLLLGIAPAPMLFLLWLIYLSLATICREFLAFQWDSLLLEAGFLAIFLSPLQILPGISRDGSPSKLVLWLLRWLLFRLMFESGCVKLLSEDPTWRNLTALSFHYETQPLPTWPGWYAHQLPAGVQYVSAWLMFAVELVVPFLIFGPRRFRHVAFTMMIALQGAIFVTGNYCFFNLLTAALCLLLLDDTSLREFVPRRWRRLPQECVPARKTRSWPRVILVPLAAVIAIISIMQVCGMFKLPWPRPLLAVYQWLAPFRSLNSYGLFAVMTTQRFEIVIEGSNNGTEWLAYEFKHKPGDLRRRPDFVAPHQPRVDWQMWFAALGTVEQNPWFVNFCVRLLEGSPEVISIVRQNPFPQTPPRYLRALLYQYHFTDVAERRKNGHWWRRDLKGIYLPVITLPPQVQPPARTASTPASDQIPILVRR